MVRVEKSDATAQPFQGLTSWILLKLSLSGLWPYDDAFSEKQDHE